jgi:hypothetical protein
MVEHFRASKSNVSRIPELGNLAKLQGNWVGSGFNLIPLPDFEGGKPFRVKLNATVETLDVRPIGGPVPNRGSAQNDIEYVGLHYLQQVSDAQTHEALHIEPGLWLNVPATSAPDAPASLVRQGTIPHGNSVLAQGAGSESKGGPGIKPVSTKPFSLKGKSLPEEYFEAFHTAEVPAGIPESATEDPNVVLTQAIAEQKIIETVTLQISTKAAGGIVNIPFITRNADTVEMEAVFWIETVEHDDGSRFMQLQYTQTVMLDFLDIRWPHVSVATLVKQ